MGEPHRARMCPPRNVYCHMPFTFSHPAIVLPLTSLPARWYSLTGLVIGSLTPDFEYFLRMDTVGEIGHTLIGIFLFDLPVGLILTFIFHNIVRNSLFVNLPKPLASRLIEFTTFNWNTHFRNTWPVVVTSILIGAASHILWDSFTHRGGFFVEVIPTLKRTINVWHYDIGIFSILQHASTIGGGIAIVYAISTLPIKEKVNGGINPKYWVTVIIIAQLAVVIRVATHIAYVSVGNVIVIAISATMIGLTVTPLVLRNSTARRET